MFLPFQKILNKTIKTVFCTLGLLLLYGMFSPVQAQTTDAEITLGQTTIAQNEPFTIAIVVNNQQLRQYSGFPNIDGFRKGNTSSSTSTKIINGKVTFSQTFTQNYYPTKQGQFNLPPFKININGQVFKHKGAKITVTEPKKRRQRRGFDPFNYDPFEDFFNQSPKEFVDVDADAFFGVSVSKDEVYVGEGFNTSLAFYVSEANQAQMQFFELGDQLNTILKQFKPESCWEENFLIEEITPQSVEINGKPYTQYKIYEANFYPLNSNPIVLPSVGLKMIKYQVARRPSFFGQNTRQDFKTFYSKEKNIKVKQLPPHPLRDRVAVGRYKLKEFVPQTTAQTGKSLAFDFSIQGEGNISAIEAPQLNADDNIEIYPPNTTQNISRTNSRVIGAKKFSYFIVPNEPGTFNLANYFSWVYFDPYAEKYDTLQSNVTLKVTGPSRKNQAIQSNIRDNFYGKALFDQQRNGQHLRSRYYNWYIRVAANLALLVITGSVGFLLVRKAK